ncbi:MAG: saccharopine dehydrogenase NADP-binding domain-containing protein [Bacteroidia bacterium]
MKQTVCILGGYGGVGKSLSQALLKYTDCNLIIAGRRKALAEEWGKELSRIFPERKIMACFADTCNHAALTDVFRQADLVVVTATVADSMGEIASAAIDAGTGLIDIMLRGDVAENLLRYEPLMKEKKLRFITQAGFHPGLVAPLIRSLMPKFDQYHSATIGLAMDPIFRNPESTHELFHEIVAVKPMILQSGKWKEGSYRDLVTLHFPRYFGLKKCFPFALKEIQDIEKVTGLRDAGVYAAGFDFWIDWVIFPVAMVAGLFSAKWSKILGGKMLFAHIKKRKDQRPRVEMVLEATGIKDGKEKKVSRTLSAEDGFDLTAYAVLACIRQYFSGILGAPGLYLMGQIVEEKSLLEDLKIMGVTITDRE